MKEKVFIMYNIFKEHSHVLLDFILKICLQADRCYNLTTDSEAEGGKMTKVF